MWSSWRTNQPRQATSAQRLFVGLDVGSGHGSGIRHGCDSSSVFGGDPVLVSCDLSTGGSTGSGHPLTEVKGFLREDPHLSPLTNFRRWLPLLHFVEQVRWRMSGEARQSKGVCSESRHGRHVAASTSAGIPLVSATAGGSQTSGALVW